jgi:hypothetical protein
MEWAQRSIYFGPIRSDGGMAFNEGNLYCGIDSKEAPKPGNGTKRIENLPSGGTSNKPKPIQTQHQNGLALFPGLGISIYPCIHADRRTDDDKKEFERYGKN